MPRTLTDPTALKPCDVEAHLRLDDDGNPWRPPHEPEPAAPWTERLREQVEAIGRSLDTHTLAAMGVALGVGLVLGRVLAARASS